MEREISRRCAACGGEVPAGQRTLVIPKKRGSFCLACYILVRHRLAANRLELPSIIGLFAARANPRAGLTRKHLEDLKRSPRCSQEDLYQWILAVETQGWIFERIFGVAHAMDYLRLRNT